MAHRTNYEVRWKNFRGFRDTDWIEIRPLTILLGPNNSGKSSLTAPLLLMSQTLASAEDISSALITRGPYIDVGRYEDLIFKHDVSRDLFFGIRFHVHDRDRKIEPVGEYPPGVIELTFKKPDPVSDVPVLRRYEVSDMYLRPFVRFSRHTSSTFHLSGVFASGLKKMEMSAIQKAPPINFLFSGTNVTRELYESFRKKQPDAARTSKPFSKRFSQFLTAISYTMSEVRGVLYGLGYIGPLREKPKRYYEVLGEHPTSIGPRGENAPHLLRLHKSQQKEVNRWIRAFGLGTKVKIQDHFEDVFSVVVSGARRNVDCNLADIGFGASQVFPLIVQEAISGMPGRPVSDLTIAEQPEIHLNPRLQRVLADLFVSMAKKKRHVIVETHSEHLILRLRRLIAEKKLDPKDVGMYFIGKKDGESTIKNIPIDSLGHVKKEDWPEGFFADALQESLELAEAQFRARKPTTSKRRSKL